VQRLNLPIERLKLLARHARAVDEPVAQTGASRQQRAAGIGQADSYLALDGFRAALLANRAQFFHDIPAGPFYGFNRPGANVSDGIVQNWWRQGMMGGAKAHYDCIKAFSETDFTADLKKIDVPVLVMHGGDDQIVPIADSAPLAAKLLRKGTLKVYDGLPHGMATTHAEIINPDLLAFFKA
jgi:non-heme chloroperoxidase